MSKYCICPCDILKTKLRTWVNLKGIWAPNLPIRVRHLNIIKNLICHAQKRYPDGKRYKMKPFIYL